MKKAIYKFSANCGRQGKLEGIFTATPAQVKKLIESEIKVYFGEVLGKHSEVCGAIEKKDITRITNNSEVVEAFEKNKLESGHNPFNYSSVNFEMEGFDSDELGDMTVGEIVDKLLQL